MKEERLTRIFSFHEHVPVQFSKAQGAETGEPRPNKAHKKGDICNLLQVSY